MNNSQTISKLKALIEALELLTDADEFVPNMKQWTKIKSLIELLDEDVPLPVAPQQPAPVYGTGRAPQTPQTQQTSSFAPKPAPNSPNPWANGTAASRFPEIPVGDAPVISDSKIGGSGLTPPSSGTTQNAGGEVIDNVQPAGL